MACSACHIPRAFCETIAKNLVQIPRLAHEPEVVRPAYGFSCCTCGWSHEVSVPAPYELLATRSLFDTMPENHAFVFNFGSNRCGTYLAATDSEDKRCPHKCCTRCVRCILPPGKPADQAAMDKEIEEFVARTSRAPKPEKVGKGVPAPSPVAMLSRASSLMRLPLSDMRASLTQPVQQLFAAPARPAAARLAVAPTAPKEPAAPVNITETPVRTSFEILGFVSSTERDAYLDRPLPPLPSPQVPAAVLASATQNGGAWWGAYTRDTALQRTTAILAERAAQVNPNACEEVSRGTELATIAERPSHETVA